MNVMIVKVETKDDGREEAKCPTRWTFREGLRRRTTTVTTATTTTKTNGKDQLKISSSSASNCSGMRNMMKQSRVLFGLGTLERKLKIG
jgi:hypothetical protein